MAKHANHYETLEISQIASQAEIKQAYRRLAKLFHPDSHRDTANHDRIAGINEAYEVLGDPERRRSYDWSLGKTQVGDRQQRQRRAATVQHQHKTRRRTGQDSDYELNQWLQRVYRPVNQLLCKILNPLKDEINQLAADPFDDELLEDFQLYLEDCRSQLIQAHQAFRSRPNPPTLAGVATNLYYCLNQVGDGIEELERFTYCYDDHYLHTGEELFRIAGKLRQEAQFALRHIV